jgi:cell filamentation protein
VASIALFVFEDEPFLGPANENRLCETHRAIFEELYEWAGTYRENVGTMTKGRDSGYEVTYGDSQFVVGEMHRIFEELAQEDFLRGLAPDEFAARLAYFYSEIDATHPFREGNSRTLRRFSADLASAVGYELNWEPTGRTQESKNALYMARDVAFQRREYEKLIAIMRSNLTPLQP